MKIITHKDILSLDLSPQTCYDWVLEMLKNKEQAVISPKAVLRFDKGGIFGAKAAYLPDYGWMGVKNGIRHPSRVPTMDNHIVLYDAHNGHIQALIDANYITAMRTGAVAAHSVELFARKDFSTLGIIGLGNVARATMQVLLSLYPNRAFRVKLMRYQDDHSAFARFLSIYENVSVEVADSYTATVTGSDVIVSAATYFGQDICEDSCFAEGCLVVPIHTRGFTNCDLFFDKIFADDGDQIRGFKNFDRFKNFAEIPDVVTGKSQGRAHDKERILAYSIGLAMHDVFFAGQVYTLLKDGTPDISLGAPQKKYWM